MGIHLFYDLIVVVTDSGELPAHIVECCDELRNGRVTFMHDQLSAEDSGKNKAADVWGALCLFEHLPKTGILLFRELKIVAM